MKTASQKNILLAYLISFNSELFFPVSVWLFYYLNFLDFKQIGLLTAIKLIATNIFEVPTGVFADLVGRKKAIILSFFLYAVVMLGFTQTTTFSIFVIWEILRALSNAFLSGSLEALIYDSLKQDRQTSRFDQVIANVESLAWLGLFLAAIGGGYLYYFWDKAPFLIQGILYLITAGLAFGLTEPRLDSQKYHFSQALKLNLAGIQELFGHFRLGLISLLFITIGAGYLIASEMLGISQAREYGLDSRGVGLLFGIGYIISAAASQFYPTWRQKLGAPKLLVMVTGILLSSFLLAKWVGVTIGSILIISRIASSTTFRNLRSSIINSQIKSAHRATTISSLVLLTQLPMAGLAYFLGDYIDHHSPNSLAWGLGLIMLGIISIEGLWLKLRRK